MASLLKKSKGANNATTHTDWRRSAGDFTCTVCRRKRLPASAFSKTQSALALKTYKNTNVEAPSAKCKMCVQAAATAEQEKTSSDSAAVSAAATTVTTAMAATSLADNDAQTELIICSSCEEHLPTSCFTNSQKLKISRNKKGRCKECVAKSEVDEIASLAAKKEQERAALVARAKNNGVAGRLALACAETANEAMVVTGARIKKGRTGGGGRWRGRGRGRGRGGGRGGRR